MADARRRSAWLYGVRKNEQLWSRATEPQVLPPGSTGRASNGTASSRGVRSLSSSVCSRPSAAGTHGKAEPIVDLNFNLTTEGARRTARALSDRGWRGWGWILRPGCPRLRSPQHAHPDLSGENLYGARAFGQFEAGAIDVAAVDVIWNGFAQSKKIADLAETYEMNCAPHNYYSHLATFISAQWCAAIPNMRILEVDVDDVPWKDELHRDT